MSRFMMKSLFIVMLALGGLLPVLPNEAFCLSCTWRGSCMGNFVCGSRCICVKRSMTDVSGFCAVRY